MWFLEMLRNNVDLKHCCVFSSYTFPLPVDCQETWGWSHLCGEHHVTETWVLGKTSKLQFQFSEKRDSLSRNPKAPTLLYGQIFLSYCLDEQKIIFPSLPLPLSPEKSICYCCSGIQSCPTLCNPMDCGMQGFPVLYHLPEFTQTHV